ncbi:tRNA (guanosine(46)-N7)-methyltransferase TrmB [Sedimentisphaera salicampi]|uniref:tRNA (guanosine(46)-N7)-methyltransferase TrmB n=1 Tax=Sedimentisphaera salicampi TaxID=1941349 RepID=UPI000B9AD67D|nr:tRNA (guanosine(46)-N7)-methyltransferase TrmB [Sedimentisphaera salicampi]OXU15421.1 tRNA (guanine-N(7)-)-methyltransferase [Sedimentisphaera salicampi]
MRTVGQLSENFIIKPEDYEGFIDFSGDVFASSGPLHIEIGSGKGTFLVHQASAEPEVNFIGIEWARKYYRYAADRMRRWGLTNVRMLQTDAAVFIRGHIADQSVDCYHIYFPDPWPKAKHNKRRFISEKNLPELIRTLKPGGIINAATDHDDYYEQICRVLFESGKDDFEEIEFIKPAGAEEGEKTGTNFERKYIPEGRITKTAAVRKKG